MRKAIGMFFILTLLAGCGTKEDMDQQRQSRPMKFITKERFEVTRVQVYQDTLAYNDTRGIYMIKDTQTGREYMGMSGVGITELGSHQSGKTGVRDER